MKTRYSYGCMGVIIAVILVACFFCACAAPAIEPVPPTKAPPAAEETPMHEAFPYEPRVDAITANLYSNQGRQTLPPDDELRNWFADYIAQAQQTVFEKQGEVWGYGRVHLHFEDKELVYGTWFDEETELFDSALYDENNVEVCWKLPTQTEYPLMIELKEKNGERVFTRIPNGKLLQTYSWSSRENSVNTDVELRYTGNLELWIDDTRHILYKNYAEDGFEMPYTGIDYPQPRLLHVTCRDGDLWENMLFLSHQTGTNGIGTWESWRLYRLLGTELQELGIAPGHEDDLATTAELRGNDIFLVFPALEQELLLTKDDFSWWGDTTHQYAVEMVKNSTKTGELETLFELWDRPVYIEYADYFSDRGPSITTITFWHGVDGPAHYYQGTIKVTYEITVEGLIPKTVSR